MPLATPLTNLPLEDGIIYVHVVKATNVYGDFGEFGRLGVCKFVRRRALTLESTPTDIACSDGVMKDASAPVAGAFASPRTATPAPR